MSPNLALDFLNRLWQPGEVRELRIPRHNRFGHTASGYFDSPEKLAVASRKWDGKAIIYVSLNPVDSIPHRARIQQNRNERAEHTTSDQHVLRRTWLFLDIDADRPSGISSTDAELAKARAVADAVAAYLNIPISGPIQSLRCPVTAITSSTASTSPTPKNRPALVKSVLNALASTVRLSRRHSRRCLGRQRIPASRPDRFNQGQGRPHPGPTSSRFKAGKCAGSRQGCFS